MRRWLLIALVVLGIAAALVLRGPSFSYVHVTTPEGNVEVQASGFGTDVQVQQGDTTVRSSAW